MADVMGAGVVLAGLAGGAWDGGLGSLDDDELTGVLRAARRLASWAAAMELASVSDLVARRRARAEADGDRRVLEHAVDEVAAALTLARKTAGDVLDLALGLDRLPLARAALKAGAIDQRKAAVIADETEALSDEHAAAVEERVLPRAPGQTTSQLRAATRRAVLAADPSAARKRKEQAQKEARVELWHEPAGTSTLAGRDLPAAYTLAADRELTAAARKLKRAGAEGTLAQLRAAVFLTRLAGQPDHALLPAPVSGSTDAPWGDTPGMAGPGAPGTGTAGPGAGAGAGAGGGAGARAPGAGSGAPGPGDAGSGPRDRAAPGTAGAGSAAWPALAGSVNLILPLSTWLGWTDAPGEVPGHGPMDADDSRTLAGMLARDPATRWCLTLTDPAGRAVAHGCARTGPPHTGPPWPGHSPPGPAPPSGGHPGSNQPPPDSGPPDSGPGGSTGPPRSTGPGGGTMLPEARTWLTAVAITPLDTGPCTHGHATIRYRPGLRLQHLVRIRHATCTHPGCRRRADACDLDHCIPHGKGGLSCWCNLHPVCRAHHRTKQVPGWALAQHDSGAMTWTAPSGRTYTTTPTEYLS